MLHFADKMPKIMVSVTFCS